MECESWIILQVMSKLIHQIQVAAQLNFVKYSKIAPVIWGYRQIKMEKNVISMSWDCVVGITHLLNKAVSVPFGLHTGNSSLAINKVCVWATEKIGCNDII